MKKFLLFMLVGALAVGCVDDNYDLSKVENDNVAIGGAESEFRMPLFVVHVDKGGLKSEDYDIEDLCQEADIWLPSVLPNGADYVDLQALLAGGDYLATMLDALIDDMVTSPEKLEAVATLIYNDYKHDITIPNVDVSSVSLEQYIPLFKAAFENDLTAATIKQEIKDLAEDYLVNVEVDALEYNVESIDIGDDVIDMLAENLDPEAALGEPNTLAIYGTLESTLPVEVGMVVEFRPTDVKIGMDVKSGENLIPETLISAEDIRAIVNGINIVIPVTIKRYYPRHNFVDGDQIKINLSLVKRGGLTLDI